MGGGHARRRPAASPLLTCLASFSRNSGPSKRVRSRSASAAAPVSASSGTAPTPPEERAGNSLVTAATIQKGLHRAESVKTMSDAFGPPITPVEGQVRRAARRQVERKGEEGRQSGRGRKAERKGGCVPVAYTTCNVPATSVRKKRSRRHVRQTAPARRLRLGLASSLVPARFRTTKTHLGIDRPNLL